MLPRPFSITWVGSVKMISLLTFPNAFIVYLILMHSTWKKKKKKRWHPTSLPHDPPLGTYALMQSLCLEFWTRLISSVGVNRVGQKCWDGTSVVSLCDWLPYGTCTLSWITCAGGCKLSFYEQPYGEDHMMQQETEAPRPTAFKELDPEDNHVNELERGSFSPSPVLRWLQPQLTVWVQPQGARGTHLRSPQISDPQELF